MLTKSATKLLNAEIGVQDEQVFFVVMNKP